MMLPACPMALSVHLSILVRKGLAPAPTTLEVAVGPPLLLGPLRVAATCRVARRGCLRLILLYIAHGPTRAVCQDARGRQRGRRVLPETLPLLVLLVGLWFLAREGAVTGKAVLERASNQMSVIKRVMT